MRHIKAIGYLPTPAVSSEQPCRLVAGGWRCTAIIDEGKRLHVCGFDLPEGQWTTDTVDACFGGEALYIARNQTVLRFGLQPPPAAAVLTHTIIVPKWSAVSAVAAGDRHLLVLTSDGSIWSWGWNLNGCLGTGDRRDRFSLQCILGPASDADNPSGRQAMTRVACGERHSCAVSAKGIVFCWGCNLRGECGDPSTNDILQPMMLRMLGGIPITEISAGLHHTIAISGSGDGYGWGSNADGQLGVAEHMTYPYPTLIVDEAVEDVNFVQA